eukprot:TRINITY_DN12767_c0_g1_i4.p1 TRINITY_DN12767_c0_g1~~TRINITY_DN12767_c0_g1_i4.p1  ORF type:complete len:142 (-),score=1.76 TRINITY_DN12767_c0_g1_i4:82-507(-)
MQLSHDASLFFKPGGNNKPGHNGTCAYKWRRCGGTVKGKPWDGPSECCNPKFHCVKRGFGWSGCEKKYTPKNGEPYDEDCAPPLGQCGGTKGYSGPTCCQPDQKCHKLGPFYSLCSRIPPGQMLKGHNDTCVFQWRQRAIP